MKLKQVLIGAVAGVAMLTAAGTAAKAMDEITVAYFLEWPMPFLAAKASGAYDEALGMKGIERLRELYTQVDVKLTYKDYGFPTDKETIENLTEESMDDPCMAFNPVGISRTPEFEKLIKNCVGV